MYAYANNMPPWMWPQGPSSQAPPVDPVTQISTWIRSLEELKKHFKEEKKLDDKKKPEQPNIFGVALLMILISPVTGPLMYHFFQMSLRTIQ